MPPRCRNREQTADNRSRYVADNDTGVILHSHRVKIACTRSYTYLICIINTLLTLLRSLGSPFVKITSAKTLGRPIQNLASYGSFKHGTSNVPHTRLPHSSVLPLSVSVWWTHTHDMNTVPHPWSAPHRAVSALHTAQSSQCPPHSTEQSVPSTQHRAVSALHTTQSSQCPLHSTEQSVPSTQHRAVSALHTAQTTHL